jgi:hypothetical protein
MVLQHVINYAGDSDNLRIASDFMLALRDQAIMAAQLGYPAAAGGPAWAADAQAAAPGTGALANRALGPTMPPRRRRCQEDDAVQ